MAIAESGDFSGKVSEPTLVLPALEVGTNRISGSVSYSPLVADEDYFRVVLSPNTRLVGAVVTIRNFDSTALQATSGTFELLPAADGNSGLVAVAGDGTLSLPITVGNPDNLVFHAFPPVPPEFGAVTSYDYEIELIVAPIEVVAGAAIHTAVEITFPAQAGQTYQLQCTDDLNAGAWVNLGARFQGQDGTMSVFDSTRHAGQRFYRVVK